MSKAHRARDLLVSATLISVLGFIPLLVASANGAPLNADTANSKIYVLDGSFVHDVGELNMNITNFGLLGSQFSTGLFYSEAPSAEWPAGSRVEHLWGAGLWVGATVDGVPRVSEGQYQYEFRPDGGDPLDTLYRQRPGERGSSRYPALHSDDDQDGLEDEDPINGLDDDGDGAIDEDAAGIGNQHFRCVMRDDTPQSQDAYPDHAPMGLSILQESFQWSDELTNDAVGIRYSITNDGDYLLESVELGLFVDFDVGARGTPGLERDDLVGFLSGNISDEDGSLWPISVAYAYDKDGDGGVAPSYFGVLLLGQGAADLSPLPAIEQPGMQAFGGQAPFPWGGDPTNDAERYEALSQKTVDSNPTTHADYRVLVSGNSLESLAPGETVVLDFAFVAGGNLQEMLHNAAEAAKTHAGRWFDRDRDFRTGVDGREFHVPWYRGPDEVWGELSHAAFRGRIQLRVEARFGEGQLSVVRLDRKNLPERSWILNEPSADKTIFFAMLLDEDRGPWPREYELRLDDQVLDELHVKNPGQGRGLGLEAYPTPFNPRVTLRYTLPQEGEVSVVIVDARGRRVRRLSSGVQPAGTHQLTWDGTDDSGSSLASGVYHAQLLSGGERTTQRLVLVR